MPNKNENSEKDSLKNREYRDKQGNVHHHTKKYEEQHGADSDRQSESRNRE